MTNKVTSNKELYEVVKSSQENFESLQTTFKKVFTHKSTDKTDWSEKNTKNNFLYLSRVFRVLLCVMQFHFESFGLFISNKLNTLNNHVYDSFSSSDGDFEEAKEEDKPRKAENTSLQSLATSSTKIDSFIYNQSNRFTTSSLPQRRVIKSIPQRLKIRSPKEAYVEPKTSILKPVTREELTEIAFKMLQEKGLGKYTEILEALKKSYPNTQENLISFALFKAHGEYEKTQPKPASPKPAPVEDILPSRAVQIEPQAQLVDTLIRLPSIEEIAKNALLKKQVKGIEAYNMAYNMAYLLNKLKAAPLLVLRGPDSSDILSTLSQISIDSFSSLRSRDSGTLFPAKEVGDYYIFNFEISNKKFQIRVGKNLENPELFEIRKELPPKVGI